MEKSLPETYHELRATVTVQSRAMHTQLRNPVMEYLVSSSLAWEEVLAPPSMEETGLPSVNET